PLLEREKEALPEVARLERVERRLLDPPGHRVDSFGQPSDDPLDLAREHVAPGPPDLVPLREEPHKSIPGLEEPVDLDAPEPRRDASGEALSETGERHSLALSKAAEAALGVLGHLADVLAGARGA